MTRLALILTASALLTGCVAGSGSPAGSRNVITSEQIEGSSLVWAYEIIERLRPEWLRSRGPTSLSDPSAGQPTVFVNATRYGDLQTLRSLRASDFREIRYLSGPEATQRFGTGYPGGVILLVNR
jgi:hypothetical protein